MPLLLTASGLSFGVLVGATCPLVLPSLLPAPQRAWGLPQPGHLGGLDAAHPPPQPGQGPQGPHEEVPLLCSSKQPRRWAGALACVGTPTPFANMTVAEKRQAPLEGFLCAACFFLISGMHRGRRDKLICSINFVNIDCAEVSCQSRVRDPRADQKPAGHRPFLGGAYLGGGRKA